MDRPTTASSSRPRTSGRPFTSAGPSYSSTPSYHPPDTGNLYAAPDDYDQDSYYQRSTGSAGSAFAFHPPEPLREEDEDLYESSSDEDVFAYHPPTTEEQHQQHFDVSPNTTIHPDDPPVYPGLDPPNTYPLAHNSPYGHSPTRPGTAHLPNRASTAPSRLMPPSAGVGLHAHLPTPQLSPVPHPQAPLPQPLYLGETYRMQQFSSRPSNVGPDGNIDHQLPTSTYLLNGQSSRGSHAPGSSLGSSHSVAISTHPDHPSRHVRVVLPDLRVTPPTSAVPTSSNGNGGANGEHDVRSNDYQDGTQDASGSSAPRGTRVKSAKSSASSGPRSRLHHRRPTTVNTVETSVASGRPRSSFADGDDEYEYGDVDVESLTASSNEVDNGKVQDDKDKPSGDKVVIQEPSTDPDAQTIRHRDVRKRQSVQSHRLSVPGSANSNGGLASQGQFHYPADVEGAMVYNPSEYTVYDEDEDEDSPYPEVRASVSNIDDPDMPVLTLRMWVLGIILCGLGGAANAFLNMRYPSVAITSLVLVLIAHPIGKFLAYTLPIDSFTLRFPIGLVRFVRIFSIFRGLKAFRRMLARKGQGEKSEPEDEPITPWEWKLELNPGPFNIKEHALIYIMTNVSVTTSYALNVIVVGRLKYNIRLPLAFSFLLVIATQMTGFGLAGAFKRFLVTPASLIWPQNLVACTLLNTLHAEDEVGSRMITRFKFFMVATLIAGVWAFFPSFIFQALSAFSWICWIAPDNIVVNQLFGVQSGLGMGILTFDWSEIAFIGSPLMVPWWAEVHIAAGFVLVYWIIVPALYYSDVWHFAHFPMMGQSAYDRFGQPYNIHRILTPFKNELNVTAYEEYSPLYLPINYAMIYYLSFAVTTAILVHTALYHGPVIWKGMRNFQAEEDDIHAKLMRGYPDVPQWWYITVLVVFWGMAMVSIGAFPTNAPVWIVVVALVFPIIYVLPAGYVYAFTAQSMNIGIVTEAFAGFVIPGDPFGNMVFKAYSTQTMTDAINFLQDLKLGHYIKLPPRATFHAQFVATLITTIIQVVVQHGVLDSVPDICTPNQSSHLTCPQANAFFTSSVVWGIVGSRRQFGAHALYSPELYALLIGAVLPLPFWYAQKRYPWTWLKYFSVPVLLIGPTYIPPGLGINYSSWFVVGFIFQYVTRRRNFKWWTKFNYILASALDSGTTIGIILIFLALELPKGGKIGINWWGNTVMERTADFRNLPWKPGPID